MTWFKVDDKLPTHPKTIGLLEVERGLEALGMWTLAGAHCASYGTGGVIPLPHLGRLVGSKPRAKTLAGYLITCGLWTEVSEGVYAFHDWHQYNLTAEKLAEIHAKKVHAGRLGGLAKRQANAVAPAKQPPEAQGSSPDPTRPDPSQKEEEMHRSTEVDRVWSAYVEGRACVLSSKGTPKLTRSRRDLIQRRLKEFDAETLSKACRGVWLSPFHLGENDRQQRYTDLELVLRDAKRIEQFVEIFQQHHDTSAVAPDDDDSVVRGPPSPEQMQRMQAFLEKSG